MKIKTTREVNYGLQVKLPIDGVVTIGKDGVVEVSEECGTLMLESAGSNWIAVEEEKIEGKKGGSKPAAKKVAEKIEEESEEEVEDEDESSTDDEEADEESDEDEKEELPFKDRIRAMELAELVALAEESKCPKAEWGKFEKKKLLLANYIIKKLEPKG